jgi:hypothetical protein
MIPPLLALFVWPLVSIVFFQRLRLPLAILVTIVGGFLLLPVRTSLDLPGLPSLDKTTIPALSALVLALIFAQKDRLDDLRPKGLIPRHPIALVLLGMLVLGAIMTALTNTDALTYGFRRLPGLRLYDAGSIALSALMMIIPFVLARRYLADPAALRLMLIVLCVAAAGYALLVLFEARMSPQLNRWVYGFFPHSWRQHVRGGAFRPVVFLNHGLVLGIFLSMSLLATLGLMRINARRRGLFLAAALWLGLTLLLSRNLGAVMITTVLLPVILFLGVRGQLLAAAIVAGVFLAYPVARTSQILPIAQVIELAGNIDPQRAGSFLTRLENEERMLAKASERPLFGWGGWGRSRVFNERGDDITIADGAWVIVIGVDGWVGYLAHFGLLTGPVFLLLLHRRRYDVGMETSVLTIILAANLVDLVPNSSNTPLTWLIAGALWGRLELQKAARTQETAHALTPARPGYRRAEPSSSAAAPPQNIYTRQARRIERKKTPVETGS